VHGNANENHSHLDLALGPGSPRVAALWRPRWGQFEKFGVYWEIIIATLKGGRMPLILLLLLPISAFADEYRLFVNDAATCASYGLSGSVCVVPLSGTSTPAPTPVQAPTEPPKSNEPCRVSVWNPCNLAGGGN